MTFTSSFFKLVINEKTGTHKFPSRETSPRSNQENIASMLATVQGISLGLIKPEKKQLRIAADERDDAVVDERDGAVADEQADEFDETLLEFLNNISDITNTQDVIQEFLDAEADLIRCDLSEVFHHEILSSNDVERIEHWFECYNKIVYSEEIEAHTKEYFKIKPFDESQLQQYRDKCRALQPRPCLR